MDLDFLLDILKESGYFGLFFWLLLGSSTLPVPNEIIMMTIGAAASQSRSETLPIFFTALGGVLTALTASYFFGRFIGWPLLNFLAKKERFAKKIAASLKLMDKYHAFSLSLSYFVPGARSVVPFLYGFSRLPIKTFVCFAYSGATAWLTIMFFAGYLFGEHAKIAGGYLEEFFLAIVLVAVIIYGLFKVLRKKRGDENEKEEPILPASLSAIQKGSPD
ncbi:DedA family protein [Neobacillus piezotolerans]|uniref:DedA family protein n=1 Tax=Neobacillus piezotolerans TaxID=2259171 RepID=A0A3D8GR04_9BACI|nr:DedA family protein [Neobacillus piezotolerans]RDU36910.1 DedA family protein [Neobacillus piezotolerans]